MRLKTRALYSLIPIAMAAPMNVGVPVGPVAEGYTITIKAGDQANSVTAVLKMTSDNMRVEAGDIGAMLGRGGGGGANAMMNGAFMLPGSDGKIIVVAPNAPNMMGGGGTGMAFSLDLAALAGRMGTPPQSTGEPTVQDLGPAETILGYKTRKYRMTSGESSVDAWIADLPGVDFKKFAMSFGARFSGISTTTANKLPSGFALKVVASGKDGGSMEVTKIEKTSFVETDFQVPAGLQVLDLGAMMGGRGRGNQ